MASLNKMKEIAGQAPFLIDGARSTGDELADFLAGRSDGTELLHELYDHVLEEKVPPSLLAMVRRRRPKS
jgi:hypothetical protein